jgi:hypothetical protein
MKGWERYYIKGGTMVENIVATANAIIKDNHFRDLKTVEKGTVLGKYIKTHAYAEGDNYFIYRSDDGLYYVSAKSCKLEKTSIAANADELSGLVLKGALYYMCGEVVPTRIYLRNIMTGNSTGGDKEPSKTMGRESIRETREAIVKSSR